MAELVLWIYIALLLVGGLVGFLKAGSKASLIMSATFAILLALCATRVITIPHFAEGLIAFLLIFFGLRFAKGRKFMPAGLMTVLSAVVLILRLTMH